VADSGLPLTWKDVQAMMEALMTILAKLDEIKELLLEDDGEEEEEPDF
jgi:hypothetical protein